jgi:DNA-binding transcriptional regulator GbsR (MarR family)
VPTQREVLRDVMLSAGKYGAWMTLHELARLTRYGETSISAQLRHLRKARCGGYVLEKRVRKPEVVASEEHFVVWEYRLTAKRLPIGRRISARSSMAARPRRIR